MTKLLSARDLLELVRQTGGEDRNDAEEVVSDQTLGRRVYRGSARARPPVLARRDADGETARQERRGPRNTQLIEPPVATGARPRVDLGQGPIRRDTVPMRQVTAPPNPGLIPAPPPVPALRDRPRLELDDEPREEAKTLELQLPTAQILATPPAAPEPAAPPPRGAKAPLSPLAALVRPGVAAPGKPATTQSSSTLRKADSKWGRPTESPASPRAAPKTPPPPRPAPLPREEEPDDLEAQPTPIETRAPTSAPTPMLVVPPAPAPAPVRPPSEPPQAPPDSAPQSSVASMFSWVTQKPAWAPSAEALEPPATERVEPPSMSAPISPRAEAPPLQAARPEIAAPDSGEEPVALSSEETLVLIHYDDSSGVGPVADATGMSEWRIQKIVERLKERGVLDPPPDSESDRLDTVLEMQAAPSSPFEEPFPSTQPSGDAHRPLKPSDVGERTILELEIEYPEARERARTEEIDPHQDPEETVVDSALDADLPSLPDDLPVPVEAQAFPPVLAEQQSPVSGVPLSALGGPLTQPTATQPSATHTAHAHETPPIVEKDEATEEAEAEEAAARAQDSEGAPGRMSVKEEEDKTKSWHALYENVLCLLNSDERAMVAGTTADTDKLFAFAYDKDPPVVRALWSNVNIRNDHARFAAFHHRTTQGLEFIGQRTEFLRDPQIQRRLIRNPMVSETLLRKMLLSKRLIDVYKITLDRDAGDRTRQSARGLLRNKFATTEAEDRLELIWKTEGRALIALSGLSIDSKTAALICARPIVSVMLVQNFAKFAATPPSVISHFLKQPMVKRQINLKHSLLKHPNCPSDAKRAF